MREEDFPCLGEPERPITEDLCRNAGARYASVFSTAEDMVKAALEVKRLNRDVWVKLPFCVTIEAEAFGAEVSLNSLYGVPAVTSFRYERLEDIGELPPLDFDQGRLFQVLRAADMLQAQGEYTMLNIEGPFTVLGQLISSKEIYKGLYRNPGKLRQICGSISRELARYAREAERHGVSLLSYADPTVASSLVSPQIYRQLCGRVSWEALQEMAAATHRVAIHLCNVTSVGFEKAGFCTSTKIAFPPTSLTYGEALVEVIKKPGLRFLGHGCVQRSYSPLQNGGIFSLQLAENPGQGQEDEEDQGYGK